VTANIIWWPSRIVRRGGESTTATKAEGNEEKDPRRPRIKNIYLTMSASASRKSRTRQRPRDKKKRGRSPRSPGQDGERNRGVRTARTGRRAKLLTPIQAPNPSLRIQGWGERGRQRPIARKRAVKKEASVQTERLRGIGGR